MNRVRQTSLIDSSMKTVSSEATINDMPSGRVGRIRSTTSATSRAT